MTSKRKTATPSDSRQSSHWSRGIVEWEENNIIHISVVFSWHLEKAKERAMQLEFQGYQVYIGGPAVDYAPISVSKWIPPNLKVRALPHHNPLATFTTRGCIRKCKFCIVPKIEGDLIELPDDMWEPKPIICDNNLLAASMRHFDHVIDRLLEYRVENIDFNQGLDARLLTPHHARRLVELHHAKLLKVARLAWDHTNLEQQFRGAVKTLRDAGMPKSKIRVYVLIGFNDIPEDALYRLNVIFHEMKILPNPMRYQPIDVRKRNGYTHPNWTDHELKRYMRYWANLRWLGSIPFEEFDYPTRKKNV